MGRTDISIRCLHNYALFIYFLLFLLHILLPSIISIGLLIQSNRQKVSLLTAFVTCTCFVYDRVTIFIDNSRKSNVAIVSKSNYAPSKNTKVRQIHRKIRKFCFFVNMPTSYDDTSGKICAG